MLLKTEEKCPVNCIEQYSLFIVLVKSLFYAHRETGTRTKEARNKIVTNISCFLIAANAICLFSPENGMNNSIFLSGFMNYWYLNYCCISSLTTTLVVILLPWGPNKLLL